MEISNFSLIEILFQFLLPATEENQGKPQLGHQASRRRLEPSICLEGSQGGSHSLELYHD